MLVLFFFVVTMAHQAKLYYQNTACTTTTPCQLQVYRATCSSSTKCPAFNLNSPSWKQLSSGSATAIITTTGTKWTVVDNDPALQDNTTYAYCATNSFTSAPTVLSNCGYGWKGTTGAANANIPSTPTVGTGNSVN